MSDLLTVERPDDLSLPKVGLEFVEITPEQRRSPFPNRLIGKTRRIEGINSWLKGVIDLLIVYLTDTNGSYVTTGGITRTADASHSPKFSYLFASPTAGLRVATGLAAVDRDDFVLDAPIADGTGSGQLVHTTPGILTKATAITGGYRLQLERSFNNDSGASITINQVGIIVVTREVGSTSISPMILKDLISPGHAVANGGAVIVRYLLDWLA